MLKRGLLGPRSSLSKNHIQHAFVSGIMKETGGVFMEQWKKDGRRDVVMVDLDALVPKEHLLRKIEKVMDYDWLYERLEPYYCHDNGRPGTDPIVLIKMVLIQHLFGRPTSGFRIRSLTAGFWDTVCWKSSRTLQRSAMPSADDTYICPHGGVLRHTTTDRDGKRTYRSTPANCKSCPCKDKCGANEKGQKIHTTHIWQKYLDLAEQIRKTQLGKDIYAQRKETIEWVFADEKGKHAMRYTHHRGLTRVTNWVRLKYADMNFKKLANWSWDSPFFYPFLRAFSMFYNNTPVFAG